MGFFECEPAEDDPRNGSEEQNGCNGGDGNERKPGEEPVALRLLNHLAVRVSDLPVQEFYPPPTVS